MRRHRAVHQWMLTLFALSICPLSIGDRGLQSGDSRIDRAVVVQSNTRNAVAVMRAISSAEAAYWAGIGKGEFGNEADLFMNDYIDADLAAALGCPKMTSAKGKICPETRAPLMGYFFRIVVTPSSSDAPPLFHAAGVPVVKTGDARTGDCTFFVDQTQVIRASDNPGIEASAKSPALVTTQAPQIRDY